MFVYLTLVFESHQWHLSWKPAIRERYWSFWSRDQYNSYFIQSSNHRISFL